MRQRVLIAIAGTAVVAAAAAFLMSQGLRYAYLRVVPDSAAAKPGMRFESGMAKHRFVSIEVDLSDACPQGKRARISAATLQIAGEAASSFERNLDVDVSARPLVALRFRPTAEGTGALVDGRSRATLVVPVEDACGSRSYRIQLERDRGQR